MAITRSQIARQLFSLGGGVSDDNLRSLGLGILGAPLTDVAPAGILGLGPMVAEGINRPTSGYETKEGKEQRDKAFEELEKEGIFEQLGIDPKDLRSQQMKDIEGQTAGLGVVSALKQLGPIGDYLIKQGRMKTYNKTIDAGKRATRMMQERLAREAARQAEFNRIMEARRAIANAGSGFDNYGAGQAAGMGFGGGRSDPTDKS